MYIIIWADYGDWTNTPYKNWLYKTEAEAYKELKSLYKYDKKNWFWDYKNITQYYYELKWCDRNICCRIEFININI